MENNTKQIENPLLQKIIQDELAGTTRESNPLHQPFGNIQ
jgi:hypothetical protein